MLLQRAYKVTTSGTPGTAARLLIPTVTADAGGLTWSGLVGTFNVAAGASHRYVVGEWVTISGVTTETVINGIVRVLSTALTSRFTFAINSAPSTTTGTADGSPVADGQALCVRAIITSSQTNAAAGVTIGPDENADAYKLGAGETFNQLVLDSAIVTAALRQNFEFGESPLIDPTKIWAKSDAASQVLTVWRY